MSDVGKDFIAYRQVRWGLKIVPRNAAGWRATIIWMLLLAPPTGLFVWAMADEPTGIKLVAILTVYLLVTAIWTVGGIRWMLARSEVIDVEAFLAQRDGGTGHSPRR